jgi:hypothetical protein
MYIFKIKYDGKEKYYCRKRNKMFVFSDSIHDALKFKSFSSAKRSQTILMNNLWRNNIKRYNEIESYTIFPIENEKEFNRLANMEG